MEPVAVIVGVEGALSGRSFEVTTTGLRLGREPGNEVCIDDPGVSRQHARVILHNGAVWVQDAGSRNGVFVNGERVADHKTMKPGDRVSVGMHTFEMRLVMPGATAAAAPPPKTPPRARPDARTVALDPEPEAPVRRWKVWPFALAIFFVLVCMGCFGAYGYLRGPPEPEAAAPSAYSLSTVVPAEGASASAAPAPSVTDALAVAAGADPAATQAAAQAALPDPPAGVTGPELVERAHGLYETGRLSDAKVAYQMALKVDPTCEICKVRIARLDVEIAEKAQAQLDAGMRYWDSMQVDQAVSAWETVLLLVPDAKDPMHVKAAEALARAKAAPPR